jgi:hypothetical protein
MHERERLTKKAEALMALSQTFELLDGHQMLQNTLRETSMRVERNGN